MIDCIQDVQEIGRGSTGAWRLFIHQGKLEVFYRVKKALRVLRIDG
jgi:hypothetical protein